MKKIIIVLLGCFSFSYVHAASCTNLTSTLVRYQETSSVLSLQKYLFEKGFLKATPNGYFGVGTFNAVKKYQKSIGLAQVGVVGPATRAAIKKDTCTINTGGNVSTTSSSTVATSTTITTQASTTPTYVEIQKSPQAIRNAKRKDDAIILLQALYRYFLDYRGVVGTTTLNIPIDLCVSPAVLGASVASGTESSILVTKDSPCASFVDISYLSPAYLSFIPRDPSLATSSNITGYTIMRSQYNDITIAAKNPEEKAIIKVTCNFNTFCKDIIFTDKILYEKPTITTLNYTTLLLGSTPKTNLIITGENFTSKNSVKLVSLYTLKEYPLGDFSATIYSATNTKISIDGQVFNNTFSCGTNCSQKIPLGDYSIVVTNEGGVSNQRSFVIKGFTTSSISTQVSSSIIPGATNIKVASLAISSSMPVALTSLTLTSTSTSKNLASKITNFIMKNTSSGTSYSGGSGTFSFSGVSLYENESLVYDIYVNVNGTMEVEDYGFITYGGKFLVKDTYANVDMEIPSKEFSFTVSR